MTDAVVIRLNMFQFASAEHPANRILFFHRAMRVA